MKREKKPKVKHTYNRTNQTAVRWLRATQRAIMHINALGFTVLSIDFTRVKPRIEVDVSLNKGAARALIRDNKAVRYSFGCNEDLGRWNGYYTMLEGIRVCWRQNEES